MNLSFEISNNSDTLERLRTVKGIGSSSFEKIKEYLSTGSLSRIREFQTDPQRVAMKNMMDIWGVGRVKVRQCIS
jgi:DNA polymerase/3'-5' exonuclease PolX